MQVVWLSESNFLVGNSKSNCRIFNLSVQNIQRLSEILGVCDYK